MRPDNKNEGTIREAVHLKKDYKTYKNRKDLSRKVKYYNYSKFRYIK